MTTISFDKDEYTPSEVAIITYTGVPHRTSLTIWDPDSYTACRILVGGDGTLTYKIPSVAKLGKWIVNLRDISKTRLAYDTMYVGGKIIPATIEVEPGMYDGRVLIETSPIGAKVYLNEVYYGRTPLDLRLPVGSYTAKLERAGYKTIILPIKVHTDFPPPEYWEILEKD